MSDRNTKQSKSNLSTKIILMVEAILLITSILFCSVSVYRARVGIRKAIHQRMLDIANCAAGSVEGDVLKHLTVDDVGGDKYVDLYNKLAVFRDNVDCEYIYCVKDEGNGNFIFTMDLDQVSPASYGDSVKYTEALANAGRGIAAVDEVPYSDMWGEFYSAYSPVFDSSGEVAGIIAVDFSADWFDDQLTAQMRANVISFSIILLFSLLVAAALSLSTVRPFVKMQGELLEEKVRAESANLAKSDFLANMSHEIRTPINAVLGMNEMILREGRQIQKSEGSDKEALRESVKNIVEYANDVENAGHNLLAIVNDILDFSKIEAGRIDLVEAPYRLSSLINDLNGMIRLKAKDKKLDFIMDVDRSLPDELNGDLVRIRQVFTNILNNAVKYTEQGSVTMTVGGKKQDDGTLLLEFSVKDTGIGIKKEDLGKLFTKFERLEMERNSTVEGTGLGLVITQRILEMMHGEIHVESEYGKGSVFTVTIPQKIVSDTPMGALEEKSEEKTRKAVSRSESFRAPTARVLVVDDTVINLTVVTKLLKNTQIHFDTASSGAKAVSMAEKIKYDAILMDQRMPGMDGTEALHNIRATVGGASSEAPVICLTADAVVGAKERYLAEGFSDYLTKPVDSYALEKLLMKFIPDEKVERVHKEEETKSAEDEDPDKGFEKLRDADIDPLTGLKYSENDEELYRTLLVQYVQSKPEKAACLKEYYDKKDWKEYSIYVHSLKSASKMIGALTLYEQAAKLEAAAKTGDGDTICSEHDAMMERYEAVVRAISSVFPEEITDEEEEGVMEFKPSDGVVLEFMPDS